MVNAGTIQAELKLDSSQYKQGLEDAALGTGKLDTETINLAASVGLLKEGFDLGKQALSIYTNAMDNTYGSVRQFNMMTGTTVEQGGKWHDMLENMGVDLNDLTFAFKMLSNNAQSALTDEKGSAASAFRTLGVSVRDTNGNLKDANDLMLETLSALQKIPAGTERNALANDTLGRSYMNLNKLLSDGEDITKKYGETTTKINTANMNSYADYKKAVNELNASINDLTTDIGIKWAPILTKMANGIDTIIIPALNDWIDKIEYAGYLLKTNFWSQDAAHTFSFEEYKDQKNINAKSAADKANASNPPGVGPDALGLGGSGGGSGSGGSGGGSSGTKQWTAQEIYAKYEAGIINKAQLNNTLKAAGVGGVVMTKNGQYYNTDTGMYSNTYNGTANPYAGNGGYYGANQYADNGTDISGSATQKWGSNLHTLPANVINALKSTPGVSDATKKAIAEYESLQAYNSSITQGMSGSELTAYGPHYAPGSIETMNQDYSVMNAEFQRLTGGDHPTLDMNGNTVIYVTIDGKEVGQAMVNKLALLGVKT